MSEDQSRASDSRLLARAVRAFFEVHVRRWVADNWKVMLYVILIILCVLFAPEEPLKFIYTEF